MKKKLLSSLLTVAMVTALLAGCGSTGEAATTETPAAEETAEVAETAEAVETETADAAATDGLAYQGDIEFMHYSTEEEAKGNGGSDGLRTMISEWETANSGITLTQSILANTEYKTQIATLAAADDLPDMFLLQGMDTKKWSEDGLVMDLTDVVANSPDNAQYNMDLATPFESDGKIYGIPALTGGTCTAIVYDAALWKEAGFDTFPTTWDDVLKAKEYFDSKGITTIGFGNADTWQANSTFLTVIGNRFTGSDWFTSLVDNSGAAFTDQEFIDALTFTKDIFASGVFNKDFNAITHYDAREYYISGQCAAYIGGNWDMSYIGTTLGESNPELAATSKLAVFPQPTNATGATDTHAYGLGYAVAINPKVAEDPDKLAACIDLAYKVTGTGFADYVSGKWALSGFAKPSSVDLSKFDQMTQDLYNFTYVDYPTCQIYDSYISSSLWGVLNTDLQAMMNGDMEPETVAENAQIAYEEATK